jgi:beta-lactamase class A
MKIALKIAVVFLFLISVSVLYSYGLNRYSNRANLVDFNTVPIQSLRSQEDANLQISLRNKLSTDAKLRNLIAEKKLSVGLVDLMDPANVRFAQINGDEMMYAASLPKIAVLLASMDAIEKGELKETSEIKSDMFQMINKSNNQATTRMIDRIGFEKIEEVLTDPQYELYNKENGGGLWVGKRYAAGGQRHPDPLLGLSHAATATQVCRFYYLMLNGKLVNKNRSKQMMDIMSNPGLHHKFVNTLEKIAPRAKLFRKSGSWENFHSDSIMVLGPERRYILVALAEDPQGEVMMRNLVNTVEEVLKIKG